MQSQPEDATAAVITNDPEEEVKEVQLKPKTVGELTESLFADQTKSISFYSVMLQHTIEKQQGVI